MLETAPEKFARGQISLNGKRLLIVGATRGLGRAIATACSEAGASLVLVSRSAGDLQRISTDLSLQSSDITSISCDVTDCDDFARKVAPLRKIDGLIYNAGINIPEPLAEVSESAFDKIFNLNVKAAFFAAQAVAPLMVSGGSITFMSSQMGHVGAANRTTYCASKHAIEGLSKALAIELGPKNVRVNTIAPTFIETDMTRPMFDDVEFRTSVISRIPLGRLGTPEEVASLAVVLASEGASLITGTSLRADGGWTAQ